VKTLIRYSVVAPLLVAALIGFGCGRNPQRQTASTNQSSVKPTPAANPEAEKFAVLSAVIKDMYADATTRLLVIEHEDPCPKTVEPLDPKVLELRQHMEDSAITDMPQLAPDTLEDFHASANRCQPLERRLDIPVKYVLVRSKDLEPLFPSGEFDRMYRRFYRKYPDSAGIINFSNPGFNRDFTQALISTGRVCGGLCGSGYFVLLEKEDDRWTVQAKVQTWIS
jgi:hypothetical protein